MGVLKYNLDSSRSGGRTSACRIVRYHGYGNMAPPVYYPSPVGVCLRNRSRRTGFLYLEHQQGGDQCKTESREIGGDYCR